MTTDADAIDRSLRGSPQAFELVFERHFSAVFRYLRRRAGVVAEDLAAETFTRAFAGRAGYDLARTDARPWLFGIATNVLRAHHRDAYVPLPVGEREDAISDPDDRLDAAAALARCAAALRALPVEQREVLLLVAVAELTYEETATALGIPVGTVRSRMSRARAALAPVTEETR